MVTRRQFLQVAGAAAASTPLAALRRALADGLAPGLSDPLFQPKFLYEVPNALNPAFMYRPDRQGRFKVRVADAVHETGLIDLSNGRRLRTNVWGYGDDDFVSWPGKTFEVRSSAAGGPAEIDVRWSNELFGRKIPSIRAWRTTRWACQPIRMRWPTRRRPGREDQGDLQQAWPLRLAPSHPLPRRSRDDAGAAGRLTSPPRDTRRHQPRGDAGPRRAPRWSLRPHREAAIAVPRPPHPP